MTVAALSKLDFNIDFAKTKTKKLIQSAVDVSFLDRLYLYRKIFRDLAICAQGVHRATVILTWVDELLARLHPVILTLAPGPYLPDHENTRTAQSIQSQKRDDILRATTQLPGMI